MKTIKTMKAIVSKVSLVLAGVLIVGAWTQAEAVHFSNPKWNGYGLDWCVNFEQNCGKPAADLYCQKKGYPLSSGFVKLNQVSFQTMTIGQNAICNPSVHRCDSFASIDCVENVKIFNYPSYNGYRLDWCKFFEQDCGAGAAMTYCQKKGFSKLVGYQKQGPLSVSTMTIGSNAICNPKYHVCDSFSYIKCKN